MSENMTGITISNVNEAYGFVGTCKTFEIHKAILKGDDKKDREVYVIGLRGTNRTFDKNDPLSLIACVKSATAKDNVYFSQVKDAIKQTAPKGSCLMFIGHSLGGMVSQQVAADTEIRTNYRVLNVMTFGSPYVIKRGKLCPLHRLANSADIIPNLLSAVLIGNVFMGNVKHENAGYWFRPVGSHCDAYMYSPVWRKYDVFGVKNGGRTLEFVD